MTTVGTVRPRLILSSGAALLAICLAFLLGSPVAAHASESSYCGGQTVGSGGFCLGAKRAYNALYGLGNSGPVCVLPNLAENGSYPVTAWQGCSPGANQGVYVSVGNFFLENPTWPEIKYVGKGSSVVYGVAFRP
jgi:hypothetical protein